MQLAPLLLLAVGQLPGPAIPTPEVAPDIKMHVEGSLTLEPGVFMLAQGYENYLRCTLEIPSGFHIYWSNPGANGTATDILVTTSADCIVGDTLYPRPEIFRGPEGDTFGYEDRVTFLVPITSAAIDVVSGVPKMPVIPTKQQPTKHCTKCSSQCVVCWLPASRLSPNACIRILC